VPEILSLASADLTGNTPWALSLGRFSGKNPWIYLEQSNRLVLYPGTGTKVGLTGSSETRRTSARGYFNSDNRQEVEGT
jgi:hypothetical protein